MSIQNELERLRKGMEAEPDNPLLREQYEIALVRADHKESLLELFQFRYLCPLQWTDLQTQKDGKELRKGVRYCTECQKEVFFVKSLKKLKQHAKADHCVAVLQEQSPHILENLAKQYGGKPDKNKIPSCIVETGEDPTKEKVLLLLGRPSTDWIV
ncbi:MAG: hypothetical protein AABZ60_22650 [Planctomycetota bacterium]